MPRTAANSVRIPKPFWLTGTLITLTAAGLFRLGWVGPTLAKPIEGDGIRKSGAARGSSTSTAEFQKLHRLIKPGPGEWKFATIPWVATIAEARVKAAKEGEPLFIWYMAGEPLGQC
jgi:hypothetical protein